MSVPRAARRRGSRPVGRAAAALLLAALAFALLAPAVLLADEDAERCCGRGRCCCAGVPSDTDCVRAACRCGAGSPLPVVTDEREDEALLPERPSSPRSVAASASPLEARVIPAAGTLRVPDQPPRPPLAHTAGA